MSASSVSECISAIKGKWLKGVGSRCPRPNRKDGRRPENHSGLPRKRASGCDGRVCLCASATTPTPRSDLCRLPSTDEGTPPPGHVTHLAWQPPEQRSARALSGKQALRCRRGAFMCNQTEVNGGEFLSCKTTKRGHIIAAPSGVSWMP